jgi:predicted LPLAT superfamily acyltransferase
MSAEPGAGWTVAERGTLSALRFAARVYELLGGRVVKIMLYPIAAYFFLRERSRDASRAYLARVWAHPEGRKHMPGPPGFFAPFWHYHEFAVQIFDRMVLWGRGLSELRMDHGGSEHLFALQRDGRGAMLISAHLGSYDMPRQLAGDYGLVLNVVMFTAHAERINRFFEQLDSKSRIRVLSLEPGSLRTAFAIKACIDRGELVGVMADRLPPDGSETPVLLPFLGREMAFPLSPFLLAGMLGCPVYLSLCLRKGDAHYETVVRPIGGGVKIPRRERERAAVELARTWVKNLEEACLQHPYQWFNFYDTWSAGGPA